MSLLFGVKIPLLEAYCEASYKVGDNPLPFLRKLAFRAGEDIEIRYCETTHSAKCKNQPVLVIRNTRNGKVKIKK